MSALIEFTVPFGEGGTRRERGYVAWLQLVPGDAPHKFVLQLDAGRPTTLTDYRTGRRVGSTAGLLLERYVAHPAAFGNGRGIPSMRDYRKAAQTLLDETVARVGLAKVEHELGRYETLNR